MIAIRSLYFTMEENQDPHLGHRFRKRRSHHKHKSSGPKINPIHVVITVILAIVLAFFVIRHDSGGSPRADYSQN